MRFFDDRSRYTAVRVRTQKKDAVQLRPPLAVAIPLVLIGSRTAAISILFVCLRSGPDVYRSIMYQARGATPLLH